MKTQSILVIFLSVICVGLLWFSASTWQEKLRNAGGRSGPETENLQKGVESDGGSVKKTPEQNLSVEAIRAIGTSLDEETLEVLVSRAEAGESVQMLIVGSEALTGVAERFSSEVRDAYGGLIGVDVSTFAMTSAQFVTEALESGEIDWDAGYDIVLYEPFTLHNNDNVIIEDERQHLLEVKVLAESHVADVSFLVTPPQPIYKAGYYLTQIAALEKFTTARGIPYLDHWANWPDTGSDELLTSVDEAYIVTELGVKAWSDALIAYFVGGESVE